MWAFDGFLVQPPTRTSTPSVAPTGTRLEGTGTMNILTEKGLLEASSRIFGDEPAYEVLDTTDRYSYKKIAGSSDSVQTYDTTAV